MRQGILALVVAVVLVAGLGVGYIGGVANRQTVTTTTTLSCPTASPNVLGGGGSGAPAAFLVTVAFQGQWNAVVTTYSAFQTTLAYLHSTCDYAGSNNAYVYVNPWNSNGEQTVKVTAYKLDSGNGNLTVSVGYGAALRSNSTVSPFGSTTAFAGTAP